MHCGCIDPGSIPGLDMHPYFTYAQVLKSKSHSQVCSRHADGEVRSIFRVCTYVGDTRSIRPQAYWLATFCCLTLHMHWGRILPVCKGKQALSTGQNYATYDLSTVYTAVLVATFSFCPKKVLSDYGRIMNYQFSAQWHTLLVDYTTLVLWVCQEVVGEYIGCEGCVASIANWDQELNSFLHQQILLSYELYILPNEEQRVKLSNIGNPEEPIPQTKVLILQTPSQHHHDPGLPTAYNQNQH